MSWISNTSTVLVVSLTLCFVVATSFSTNFAVFVINHARAFGRWLRDAFLPQVRYTALPWTAPLPKPLEMRDHQAPTRLSWAVSLRAFSAR